MTAPRRILIVNPFGIGDVLFTTPLVRAIKQAFPESRIAYLCNRRTQPILLSNPHVDEVLVYERDELDRLWHASPSKWFGRVLRLIRRAHRRRFDLAIDVSLGERYSFIVRMLGVRRLAGFDYRGRGRFLTARLPIEGYRDRHVVEHYRTLLAFLGVRLHEARLEVRPPAEAVAWAMAWAREHRRGGPLVGVVPAGGVSWGIDAGYRRWTLEGFAAVGDAMAQRPGARVVLLGERSDADVCGQVAQLMRHDAINFAGQTTLERFVALLAQLDLVVCNDGGPLHLAVSQGVKTVSVFGPVDPRVYGPYPADPERHRVVLRRDLPCRPCYHQFRLPPCPYDRACLNLLEPDDVVQACHALLSN